MLRIIVRGRQLAFRVFEVREKPRTAATAHVPTPSERMPRLGPATATELKGLKAQNEAHWEPPQLRAPSAGKPSEASLSRVAPEHTSLRTGRVAVHRPTREAVVLIDGVFIGNCPVTTMLVAGRHTITVWQPQRDDQVAETVVEAGKTLRLRIGN